MQNTQSLWITSFSLVDSGADCFLTASEPHWSLRNTTREVALIWPRFDSSHRYEERRLLFFLTLALLVYSVRFSKQPEHIKGTFTLCKKKKKKSREAAITHAVIYSELKIHSLSRKTRTSSMCVRALTDTHTHTPKSFYRYLSYSC